MPCDKRCFIFPVFLIFLVFTWYLRMKCRKFLSFLVLLLAVNTDSFDLLPAISRLWQEKFGNNRGNKGIKLPKNSTKTSTLVAAAVKKLWISCHTVSLNRKHSDITYFGIYPSRQWQKAAGLDSLPRVQNHYQVGLMRTAHLVPNTA